MKAQYDFARAQRGAVAAIDGKTRITLLLDDAVVTAARTRAQSDTTGSQSLINDLLRQALAAPAAP
ncbi:hypothetical protein [Pseudomonas vanderleydeniana]|uniref:BrnA antitoxin family protein n=1 Tax=Pseudomonas vanderleydeniana TaxID=2745495 RepID=A0A9E6TQG5_9PSED|nr:hypothetical protein [Pseudomonas vanderleydeniana]QXI26486.1 BrnA antitoxin family protein [Pseudomonas vanderleydeniana]